MGGFLGGSFGKNFPLGRRLEGGRVARSGEVGSLREGRRIGESRFRSKRLEFVRDSVTWLIETHHRIETHRPCNRNSLAGLVIFFFKCDFF